MQVAEAALNLALLHAAQPHTGLSELLTEMMEGKAFSKLAHVHQNILGSQLMAVAAALPVSVPLLENVLGEIDERGMNALINPQKLGYSNMLYAKMISHGMTDRTTLQREWEVESKEVLLAFQIAK